MSAEDVRSFCTAHLVLTLSLDFLTGEGDAVTTTLKIKIEKPDPDQLMTRLGFDEQAKTWERHVRGPAGQRCSEQVRALF